jgi:hypothetical protein
MDHDGLTLERVGTGAAYLLAGAVGTAAVAIALTPVVVPLQQAAYASVYAQLGPWRATEAAVILAGAIVGLLAVAVPTLLVTALRGKRAAVVPVLVAFGAAFGVSVFVVVFAAVLGLLGLPTAFAALVVATAAIGTVLYYLETGIRAIATFAGGVPVFALLILVLAVGLGWGGGYDLVATERPDATDAAADFEEAPAVRDDLLRAGNREGGDGEPATYRLPLRGYDGESRAARFLDAHGVRCPYLNANAGEEAGSFVAEHDGTYYRVTCVTYGD